VCKVQSDKSSIYMYIGHIHWGRRGRDLW